MVCNESIRGCRQEARNGFRLCAMHADSNNRKNIARRAHAVELIRQAKNKPCMDCNVRYPYFVMELDHVRGEKQFNVSRAATGSTSIGKVQEEIAKCDVVCANCHRIRTWERMTAAESAVEV